MGLRVLVVGIRIGGVGVRIGIRLRRIRDKKQHQPINNVGSYSLELLHDIEHIPVVNIMFVPYNLKTKTSLYN